MAALAMMLGHERKPDPNTIVTTEDKPFVVLDQYGKELMSVGKPMERHNGRWPLVVDNSEPRWWFRA